MENAPQLALALEDQPPPWSFGEFAVIAGWIFFLWSTLRWLWTLGHWLCPKDVSAEASKGIRGGGQSRTGSTGKGQGRKGRGTQGCITFRRSSRPTLGDEKSGEKRLSSKALIESPEARAAQGHLLEAMVQRAHPVVQDLHDMHRLGGVGPGTMLRRGSRLQ